MSIIRHEIRKISDENRGQPIISKAVVHGNVPYFAGSTPNPIVGDIKTQTAQVLRRVDELLNLAGTDKSQLLSAPRSGLPTCVCSKITILFGTSGSIRQTLRRGLASRPTFGDLGCSLKSWWLRPCHKPIAVREADQSAHMMRELVPGYAAGHRSDAGTACFHISACKGIGVHKGSFAVSPRFRRLAGDSSGSQPPVQLACCLARSSPLRAQERRVFACPVLYRSGALGGIRTPDPQNSKLCALIFPTSLAVEAKYP